MLCLVKLASFFIMPVASYIFCSYCLDGGGPDPVEVPASQQLQGHSGLNRSPEPVGVVYSLLLSV